MPLRSFTDAEVLVSERRRLERPLVVLVWLGVVLFSLADGIAFYVLAATLAAGIKLYVVGRGKELYLRRFFVNGGVLLSTGVLLAELLTPGVLQVKALGHYLILIQLCKLFERSGNRDYVQFLVLSFLTAMAACIFCDQLWLAVAMAGYLALFCHTAMVLTLKRGLDAAAQAHLPTETGPMPAHRVAWNVRRGWPGKPLRRLQVPVMAALLGMGVVVFLVAPRIRGASLASARGEKSAAVTGYSSTVQLGDARSVYLSDHVAMRVRLSGGEGGPSSAEPRPYYLRGHVLGTYAKNRWSEAPVYSGVACPEGTWRDAPGDRPRGPMLRQEFRMLQSLLPTLFAVQPPFFMQIDANAGRLYVYDGRQARLVGPSDERTWAEYAVESWAEPLSEEQKQWLAADAWDDARRLDWQGVDVVPRVRELARRWCQDLLARRDADPARRLDWDLLIAERLADHLRREYKYSLDLARADPMRDGVDNFLFDMKQGHCEYFASALTIMCRGLGVRSRLATGFHIDPSSRQGDWYVVRDRDAHAWTEVYSTSAGWVIVDATPPGSPLPVARSWLGRLLGSWEDAQQFWDLRVVRYSEQDRLNLGSDIGRWFRRIADSVKPVLEGIGDGVVNLFLYGQVDEALKQFVIALGAIAALAEAAVVVSLLRRRGRRARVLRGAAPDRWKQMRFMLEFLRLVERRGFALRAHRTPRETARAAALALHLPPADTEDLVDLYYRLRWGARDAAPDELHAAHDALARIRLAAARKP